MTFWLCSFIEPGNDGIDWLNIVLTLFSLCSICTVWKLASVAISVKSKNVAKNISNLDYWVPIERDDIQQGFDTRFDYLVISTLNGKASNGSSQINQKASIQPPMKFCIFKYKYFMGDIGEIYVHSQDRLLAENRCLLSTKFTRESHAV